MFRKTQAKSKKEEKKIKKNFFKLLFGKSLTNQIFKEHHMKEKRKLFKEI